MDETTAILFPHGDHAPSEVVQLVHNNDIKTQILIHLVNSVQASLKQQIISNNNYKLVFTPINPQETLWVFFLQHLIRPSRLQKNAFYPQVHGPVLVLRAKQTHNNKFTPTHNINRREAYAVLVAHSINSE